MNILVLCKICLQSLIYQKHYKRSMGDAWVESKCCNNKDQQFYFFL